MFDFLQGRITALASATLFVLAAQLGGAQETIGSQRRQATRRELEEAVAATEAVALRADTKTRLRLQSQVASLRQRLKNGDFAPGDRVMLAVQGDTMLTDTFTVRQDQKLLLPNIPEISLRGVLDSELAAHLTKELGRYLRDPRVQATGLIRVSLSGAIAKPGFVTVPIDMLVSDVLMAQGGPAPMAKMDEARVVRGKEVHLDKGQLADALRAGRSVGDVALRDGDEIQIPVTPPGGRFRTLVLPILTSATGIYWIINRTTRSSRP